MTGKLPAEKESSSEGDESAPSKKSAGEKPGKAAPASDAGNQRRQGRTDADTRKEELNREIRDLLAKRDALRQEAAPPAKKEDVKAEPSTAPENGRPVKPKQEDFDDWDKYDKAQDKYVEDLADWKAAQRIEATAQRQRQESLTAEMQKRLDSAKERYGEESETTITTTAKSIFSDDKVPPAIKAALGRSEVIVDALYVIGSDATEFADFLKLAKTDPLEALRKWFTVEALVKEELKSGTTKAATERAPDGKFVAAEKAEKPARREAPPPPRELNGNAAPPGDERERAAKTNDFRSFKADADRRDVARFKGQ
ncbi:MAG TPA: hypothetical protein VGG62_10525 [Terracidiphilus sp.]|jgi:hypothetical protein